MGGLLSGILGGGDSGAQAAQQAALQQSRDAAHTYRPEAMQARLNLLNKASGAYQGMNNALETMYGGRGPKVGGRSEFATHDPGAGGKFPNTFGGHQLPQQPMAQQPMPQRGPQPQQHTTSLLDPLGLFGGR